MTLFLISYPNSPKAIQFSLHDFYIWWYLFKRLFFCFYSFFLFLLRVSHIPLLPPCLFLFLFVFSFPSIFFFFLLILCLLLLFLFVIFFSSPSFSLSILFPFLLYSPTHIALQLSQLFLTFRNFKEWKNPWEMKAKNVLETREREEKSLKHAFKKYKS